MINIKNFVKQQPNMMLVKNDVELLLKYNFIEHFRNMQCPDEHYFINIILNIYKRDIIKKQIHFCNPDFHKTQALEYDIIDINLINKIRNYGFLFIRKVKKESLIDINYILS
jgi:hypothetical protein